MGFQNHYSGSGSPVSFPTSEIIHLKVYCKANCNAPSWPIIYIVTCQAQPVLVNKDSWKGHKFNLWKDEISLLSFECVILHPKPSPMRLKDACLANTLLSRSLETPPHWHATIYIFYNFLLPPPFPRVSLIEKFKWKPSPLCMAAKAINFKLNLFWLT